MKKVELVPGIKSSVLGFGCAPIMGSAGAGKSARTLAAAIDKGITHFDIARSYGYGEAECFVGKTLKPYRKDIVIASKFGIKANFKAKLLSPLKPTIRFARELKSRSSNSPVVTENRTITTIADRFHYRIELTPAEMKKSLEESLKALKTDYLDYFFIHEPDHSIRDIDGLFRLADDLKKEGKIRAFGLAFYIQEQKKLHEDYLERFDILQFNNSPEVPGYDKIKHDREDKANIFFSPISGGSAKLSPSEKLMKLHEDFDRSVILCSMFNEKHLEANTRLFL